MENAPEPAAYCRVCKTIFAYEKRDLFDGEVFCPSCSSRTEPEDRALTLAKAAERYPHASVYGVRAA